MIDTLFGYLELNPLQRLTIINTTLNTFTGLFLSMSITHFYMLLRLGYTFPWYNNIELTAILTVVSLIRGYLFARDLVKRVQKLRELE